MSLMELAPRLELNPMTWPCFPAGTRIEIYQHANMADPCGGTFAAHVTGTDLTFRLKADTQRGAMDELAGVLALYMARWWRHPLRAGRHDRGWPRA
jgi:hypothetical protein